MGAVIEQMMVEGDLHTTVESITTLVNLRDDPNDPRDTTEQINNRVTHLAKVQNRIWQIKQQT